jgi:hypothetical protein
MTIERRLDSEDPEILVLSARAHFPTLLNVSPVTLALALALASKHGVLEQIQFEPCVYTYHWQTELLLIVLSIGLEEDYPDALHLRLKVGL